MRLIVTMISSYVVLVLLGLMLMVVRCLLTLLLALFLLVYTILSFKMTSLILFYLVVGAGAVVVAVVIRNTLHIVFPFLVAGVNSLPIFGAVWAPVKSKKQDDGLLYTGGIFVGGGGGV